MTTAEMQAQSKQMAQSPSPQEISKAFFAMVDKAAAMSAADIDSLSEEEVLELGKPILDATRHTIQVDEKTIQEIADLANNKNLFERNQSTQKHLEVSQQIEGKILSARTSVRQLRAYDVKNILLEIQKTASIQSLSTCSNLFNVSGGNVFLFPGDQLDLANSVCPAGSYFYLTGGSYYGQSVISPRNGNRWVGAGSWQAILDGQGNTSWAFGSSNITNNEFRWFIIKNYSSDGIFSGSGTNTGVRVDHMKFTNIAPGSLGKFNGAVRFENCSDIEVNDSYFEDVSAGVLFTNCDGPLKTLNNEALNPGRNFFQCDKCEGAGIRVNGNSLEHTTGYGNAVLEDWINIFNSHGTQSDWIEVNNNRARGHSNSNSGSFIILADSTGTYQKAIGNIGVSPGQVGVGVASGEHILVEGNKMFSDNWMHSNVAYYSIDFHSPCDHHEFPASPNPNIANWRDSIGVLNRAASNGKCGISNTDIRTNVEEDTTMGPEIWNLW
jgi:hypothetical protein